MNKWLQNEYVLRIISILLGILLWAVVNQTLPIFQAETKMTKTMKNVPLDPIYDSNEMEIVEIANGVDVTLQGNSFLLDNMPDDYHVYVDLRDFQSPGVKKNVPVQIKGVPFGVSARINPNTVTVRLEKKEEKELPVESDWSSPAGVVSFFSPERVKVKGKSSLVSQVESVKAIIPEDYLERGSEITVPVKAFGKKGQIDGVTLSPDKVKLKIAKEVKEVPLVIKVGKKPPEGYKVESISYFPRTVRLMGEHNQLSSISEYTGPVLDLSDVTESRKMLLKIPLTSGIQKVAPEEVDVYVKITRIGDSETNQPDQEEKVEQDNQPQEPQNDQPKPSETEEDGDVETIEETETTQESE